VRNVIVTFYIFPGPPHTLKKTDIDDPGKEVDQTKVKIQMCPQMGKDIKVSLQINLFVKEFFHYGKPVKSKNILSRGIGVDG
jgi:hypothetical protein